MLIPIFLFTNIIFYVRITLKIEDRNGYSYGKIRKNFNRKF